MHTTHLFFALSDVISVNTVFDPVTVIIPYDGQDGYKSENFVISRSDMPSGVEILIEDPNGTHQVNIDKVTGEANYWFFV
ncbi:MAG: hypothetical protein KatS3mg087_0456 [Patescibacteria group bacterium]|nr:MAG: hypothetical protein KatS3mg087_0456 [Patescibacteria group bacterium]